MNLLYLSIIIPLFSALILVCFRRHIKIQSTLVIGFSTIVFLTLLMVFVVIDYQQNTLPDTSLIYSRSLWDWVAVGRFNVSITLFLDLTSLVFLCSVIFFSFIIYLFAACYLNSLDTLYSFFAYGNLLLSSLILLILADNLLIFFIGWEGVSFATYLLLSLYQANIKLGFTAIRAFLFTHITELLLLVGILIIYSELGTLNIRDVLSGATNNLAIDSSVVMAIAILLFIGVIGRVGLFPFHAGFSSTANSSMPALTLLQSSVLVLSGGYAMIRFSPLFLMSTDVFKMIEIIAAITVIFAGCISLVQNDIKRLVTYINLGQIAYIFFAFTTQNLVITFSVMENYSLTSCLLLLCSAMLIRVCKGERDIHKMSISYKSHYLLYLCFWVATLSIITMPWITATFYIKGDIISELIIANEMGVAIVALVGIMLFTLSILRLVLTVFHHQVKVIHYEKITTISYVPLVILIVAMITAIFYLPAPVNDVITNAYLSNKNLWALQLLLTSITILGILIAYVLFVHSKTELNELVDTPIGKVLMHLWTTEWRFDKLIKYLFIVPYLYLIKVLSKDPLSKWILWINLSIKKVNIQIVALESGKLRWYTMSIIAGSLMILFLLILI